MFPVKAFLLTKNASFSTMVAAENDPLSGADWGFAQFNLDLVAKT
jgi:hypothetical protein